MIYITVTIQLYDRVDLDMDLHFILGPPNGNSAQPPMVLNPIYEGPVYETILQPTRPLHLPQPQNETNSAEQETQCLGNLYHLSKPGSETMITNEQRNSTPRNTTAAFQPATVSGVRAQALVNDGGYMAMSPVVVTAPTPFDP